jgi:spermidine synthase
VPIAARDYMGEYNFDVVKNPKVSIVLDDARHYLMTTNRKFDAITSDPLDPWVKGAAMLYTREFWEIVKEHLNPGGVVTVFVQLYESNLDAVKSEIATFFEAFPHGMIFANLYNGQGYDVVLLGQLEPTRINLDDIEARLNKPEYARMKQSLSEIGMHSAVDLFGTYAGQASDFKEWVKTAQINRDRNLRLQYLAGRGLNLYQADVIYRDMAIHGQEPKDIFEGSDQMKQALLGRIRVEQGRQ